jgi:tRNA G10  N-methylase Trm11
MVNKSDNSKIYAFILGRERELCLAELKAVLKRFCFDFGPFDELRAGVSSVSRNVAFINITECNDEEIAKLAPIFGGTMKIFRILDAEYDSLSKQMINYLSAIGSSSKLEFGISSYSDLSGQGVFKLGLTVKKGLKGKISTRFVAPREGKELSTIVSLKNKLCSSGVEFGLFETGIGVLIGLSDPEKWGERDYGKPAGDKRSGMLPPKLARIMVNLALGQSKIISNSKFPISNQFSNLNSKDLGALNLLKIKNCKLKINERQLVVDPFCGSGNILSEALMLDCDVFGSDTSEKAVKDTKANIKWLMQISNIKSQNDNLRFEITRADATNCDWFKNFSTFYPLPSTPVVVTEPFLGEPKKYEPSMNAVLGEYGKIKEMYLNFLKNIRNVISSDHQGVEKSLVGQKIPASPAGGSPLLVNDEVGRDDTKSIVLCLVFPLVETIEGKQYSLYKNSVDEIKKIGYTELHMPMVYGRDYQIVKREIVLLKFEARNSKLETNSN